MEYKILSEISDTKGRYVIIKIEIQGSLFILVNYYGPNTQPEQVKRLKEIDNHLKNLTSSDNDDAKIILVGISTCTLIAILMLLEAQQNLNEIHVIL